MPTAEEKARGGVKKYRTISLPGNKYMHVGVVPKAGPKGGHTVGGEVNQKKGSRGPMSLKDMMG